MLRSIIFSAGLITWAFPVQGQTPGSNDAAFNPGDHGFAIGDAAPPPDGSSYSNAQLTCMTTDGSGRTIWAGTRDVPSNATFGFIERHNADGSVDPSFSAGGLAIAGAIGAVCAQSDGGILIGGAFSTFGSISGRYNLIRLLPDGAIDPNFLSIASWGSGNPQIRAIIVQPDGKIIIGGTFNQYNGSSASNVTRLNTDGTRDISWPAGTTGGTNGPVYALAQQSDGKVLVAGDFSTAGGFSRVRVARLSPAEVSVGNFVDNTFTVGAGCNAVVRTLALQSDGKVLLGGDFTLVNGIPNQRIVRLASTGAADGTFTTSTGFDGSVASIALRSDGSIVVGGDFAAFAGSARNRIAMLASSGALMNNFDPGSGPNGHVACVSARPDSKIMAIGNFTTYANVAARHHVRLDLNGGVDNTYAFNGSDAATTAVAVQDDGTILIAGQFSAVNGSARSRIVRLLANGSVDPSFVPTIGYLSQIENGRFLARDMIVQPDGRILVAGTLSTNTSDLFGSSGFGLARLLPSGTVDTSFTAAIPYPNEAQALSLMADGRMLASTNAYNAYLSPGSYPATLKRYNADGSVDGSFLSGTTAGGSIHRTALFPDGKVLVVGDFVNYAGSARSHIVRLNDDGTIDDTFNYATGFSGGSPEFALTYADGRCVLSGSFTAYDGNELNGLARLNADGSLDPSFAPAVNGGGPLMRAYDGNLMIGGRYELNEDGSINAVFNAGTGFSNAYGPCEPWATAVHEGGVIAVGDFTAFHGVGRDRIAREVGTAVFGDILLPVRVLLEGPFVQASNLMNDGLRNAGVLPSTEPFSALGFAHVREPSHSAVAPAVFNPAVPIFNSIVDWVMVELRSASDPSVVLQTRTGLIQRDGDIVNLDGLSSLVFHYPLGNYYVAIRTRNHLGCMTAMPISLSASNPLLNFSLPATATYGIEARKTVGTRAVLWAGDVDHDGALRYTGANNDRDPILVRVGSTTPNATSTGYYSEDVTMDGMVRYTGAGNDRDPILVNVGSAAPNSIRTEQLP